MCSIAHLIRINESPANVFVSLTENAAIARWFTETECAGWRKGARVTWFENTIMTISELKQNRLRQFDVEEGSGWENTLIRFELEAIDNRTLVRLDHVGWRDVSDHFRDCSMSWAYFLESLKLYLETGKGTPEGESPACESSV